MKDQFINSKIIGIIYKNLVSKLNLDLNNQEKTKLTKKIISVMGQVFTNIDTRRVNDQNFKNILRQFINNCYQIVYNDLNKDNQQSYERFSQDNKMERDRQIMGDRRNMMDQRGSYNRDDKFASFNDSFTINPRQQNFNGYSGRIDQDDYSGKKSEFSGSLEERYAALQEEYRNSFQMNRRPSTPPELKGDGGANLNRFARENLRNKQQAQGSSNNNYRDSRDMRDMNQSRGDYDRQPQMSAAEFLKPMDPKATPNMNQISRDNFNFGTANDMDNNYDTLDGNVNNYEGNMNTWNTGINPNKFQIDENTPLETRLKQYEAERANLDRQGNKEKRSVRFDDEKAFRQAQMENEMENRDTGRDVSRESKGREMSDRDRETRMRHLERERKKMEADRMVDIKKDPIRVPETEGFSNAVETKLSEYENTIGLLLDKVKDLQQQQIKYMSGGNTDADDKIRLLQAKKDEILGEVTRLQSLTLELEKQQQVIHEKEQKIRQRELDIDQKIRKYAEIKNLDERLYVIKASSGRLTYTLPEQCRNVTGIQLINYNIPYEENNINSNNNKLYFTVISDNHNNVKEDSDDDILSSDSENYVEDIHINANKLLMMTIPENNYDIYGLLEIMNKIGNKWDIQFSLVKGKIIIKTNKNNRLKLYMDREYQNNILPILGFSKIIGDKYKHTAERKYNIKNDKLVQLYLKNVSQEPFAEFLIGTSKVHQFSKEVNIDSLNRLDIELKIEDKIFMPTDPYILEFNVLMKNSDEMLQINNERRNESEDELNTEEDDLLSKVSNMMNLNN